jgi:hypothetical protein
MWKYVLLSCLLITSAALGDGALKFDFTTVPLDANDTPFMECVDSADKDCKITRPWTMGAIVLKALAMPEQGLDPVESVKRGQLALRVYKATDVQLTAEEITLIKKQMAKIYSPIVCARVFVILDPAEKK